MLGLLEEASLRTDPAVHRQALTLAVNEFQAVPEFPNVWAAGDCTAVQDAKTGTSHPPNAQHGLREGPIAAKNIEATILGRPWNPLRSRFASFRKANSRTLPGQS